MKDKVLEFERQNTRLLSGDVRVRVPSAPPRRGSQVIKALVCKTDIEGLIPSRASNIMYSGWEAIKCQVLQTWSHIISGCNSVWSEYSAWTREAVGSNPATLTSLLRLTVGHLALNQTMSVQFRQEVPTVRHGPLVTSLVS